MDSAQSSDERAAGARRRNCKHLVQRVSPLIEMVSPFYQIHADPLLAKPRGAARRTVSAPHDDKKRCPVGKHALSRPMGFEVVDEIWREVMFGRARPTQRPRPLIAVFQITRYRYDAGNSADA